jgi:hypothetical protein
MCMVRSRKILKSECVRIGGGAGPKTNRVSIHGMNWDVTASETLETSSYVLILAGATKMSTKVIWPVTKRLNYFNFINYCSVVM